jgi:membrane peptidoglycan carboxypeptidase
MHRGKQRIFLTQLSKATVCLMLSTGALSAGPLEWLSKSAGYKLPTEKIVFEKLKPRSAPQFFDRSGRPLFAFPQNRKLSFYKTLGEMDPKIPRFVVLLEDAKFYHHGGLDFEEIKNSLKQNVEQGKLKRGASTISQQLVKNLFLDKEKSFTRKLFEIPWVNKLEEDLSKAQILEIYLNIIEWGPGIYGAEAASRHFFDKSCEDLDVSEALYLALIIPNPVRFDLYARPRYLKFLESKRDNFVERLVGEKHIDRSDVPFVMAENFKLAPQDNAQREHLMVHQGNYTDNLLKGTSKWSWLYQEVQKHMKVTDGTRLTVDKAKQNELFGLEWFNEPEQKKNRFYVLKEQESIVAVLKVPAKKALKPEDVSLLEEVDRIPWERLKLSNGPIH